AGNVATFNGPTGGAVDAAGNLLVPDTSSHRVREVSPSSGFFPLGIATGAAPAEPVQLANADGVVPVSLLPYIEYDGELPAVQTGAAQKWSFIVPSGVTAFEFSVTVEAKTSVLAPPTSVSNPGPTGAGSPNVVVRTYAGVATIGFVDGPAATAQFGDITLGLALDQAGNLFLADAWNNAIRRISADGVVSTVAGVLRAGTSSGSTDGPGNLARFSLDTSGLAASGDGRTLYVADTTNQTIRRCALTAGGDPANPAAWTVSTIAGAVGVAGDAAGDGVAARFRDPLGLALDPSGILFVAEYSGHRVRRLQFTGGDPAVAANWQVRLLAGSATAAFGNTDATGSAATFSAPIGLAIDRAGSLYVVDNGSHRVRKIDPNGAVTTLAGGVSGDVPAPGYADGPGATARFYFPYGVAVDSAGFVYVCDRTNARLRRVSPSGVVSTVAGDGVNAVLDGPGDTAQLGIVQGVVVDPAGNVYATTGGRVRLIQRIISGN
ncbi:MAG: hypothetical protein HYU66_18405, partial [Armatimonadetes bacterium]|nr:hypothetical protein [Armatimonadota bacterium]